MGVRRSCDVTAIGAIEKVLKDVFAALFEAKIPANGLLQPAMI
jgi:hypothetical protein